MMPKRFLLPVLILTLNLNLTFGDVNTRLDLVSNNHNSPSPGIGTLVINVEAISTAGNVQINLFENAFQIDSILNGQIQSVTDVTFSNHHFPTSGLFGGYDYTESYTPDSGRISYIYEFDEGLFGGIPTSIPNDWTEIVTVTIQYTMTAANSTVSWYTGSPGFAVTNQNDVDITGVEEIIPNGLIDFPLPVELNNFAAKVNNSSVELKWQTKTEVNNYGFEIERASSLTAPVEGWEKIGFVPGNGNSNSIKNYSFVDNNPVGGKKFNYRLKQIDNDGSFSYSDIVEVELAPNKFELFQNYPNPFNPITNIKFSLPYNSRVRLDIYNIIGEHLITLIDEDMGSGFHSISFNANTLSTGTYIYKISAQDFSQTRKMVLVK